METIIFPTKANKNDKIMVNNQEIIIQNSFELIIDDNQDAYYKISVAKSISIKIDKKDLLDILVYVNNNVYTIMEWVYCIHNKKYINSKFNNSNINIVNYLKKNYDNLGNKKINVVFLNDDYYDFRAKNIKTIPLERNQLNKYKLIDTKPEYINTNEINITNIIQEFSGHQKHNGISANKEQNKYKLVKITKEDGMEIKYYEVSLGKFDKHNNEFTFIIDIEDKCILDNVYLLNNKFIYKTNDLIEEDKQKIIVYKNPTWCLLENQYIATSITINDSNKELVYIHRLLLGCQKGDDTVDHINGNKFDNRRSNLKICNMSEQNMNRGMIKRKNTLNNILTNIYNEIIAANTILNITQANEINNILFNLSFKSIDFISDIVENVKNKNTITKRYGFAIEISAARCGLPENIEICSTLSEILELKTDYAKILLIKLSHAICLRYLSIKKNVIILKYSVDNKKFENIEEFKIYTEKLLTEIMKIPYTIDSFLDYMNTLKITKYNDPRISKIITNTTNIKDIKFNFIQFNSARNKYDIEFIIGKNNDGEKIKIKKNGSGEKTLTNEEKKSFALVQRFNAFIDLYNMQKDNNKNETITDSNNKIKQLADFEMESKKFNNITELKIHTEFYVNKLLIPIIPYTLESFAEYINKNSNSKKINLNVSKYI